MTATMTEFKVEVTVKVNLDDLPAGVGQGDVAKMVSNAISDYCTNIAEAVALTGDRNDNCEAIASSNPEVEVK